MDPYRRWQRFLRGILAPPTPAPAVEPEPPPSPGERDAWPDPAAEVDGALRGVQHLGDLDRARLSRHLPRGTVVENGYAVYRLRLWSAGAETAATVAVPIGVEPPLGGWHLVANNHGTTGLARACALVGTEAAAGLAARFGANGMIGVAPEYAGLVSGELHPYLVAESESRAVLDALRAARALGRWQGWPLSGRSAMVGMSQGGHATLAAAARWRRYAPELDLRAFAVAAPASAWEEHWRVGVMRDGPHLVYHAMLVYAWAHHYRFAGPPLWSSAVMPIIDAVMRSACAWAPGGGVLLEKRLPRRASELFSRDFLQAYRSGWWGPYAPFHAWFATNRIGPWPGRAPLRVYQGRGDNAVPERATRQLVHALAAGGVPVEYEVVDGAGHHDTAFGFLGATDHRSEPATAWLRARLDRE